MQIYKHIHTSAWIELFSCSVFVVNTESLRGGRMFKRWLALAQSFYLVWNQMGSRYSLMCELYLHSSLFPNGSKWVHVIEVIWESRCGGPLCLRRAGWHHPHRGGGLGGDSRGRANQLSQLSTKAWEVYAQPHLVSHRFRVPVVWNSTQSWRTNNVFLSCLQHWHDFNGVRHCCQRGSTRKLVYKSGVGQLRKQLGIFSPAFDPLNCIELQRWMD